MKLQLWQNIFHVIVNANLTVQNVIQNVYGIIRHVNVNVKFITSVPKDYSWNPSTSICENSKNLKSVADTSVTYYDEIIIVTDNILTKITNSIVTKRTNAIATKKIITVATNVTSAASINCLSKIVRDCYILYAVLLVIILLLINTIICYHYVKQKGII